LNSERVALHKIKKISGYFTKGMPGASSLRQKLSTLHLPWEILKELKTLTDALGE
jgi:tRNA-dihydrouridine synthase